MHMIKFLPTGREAKSERGMTILEAAQNGGVAIESPCGGKGKCGKCRIRTVEGEFNVLTEEEFAFIPEKEREHETRLACRAVAGSDAIILIPDEYLLTKEASRKTFAGRVVTPKPAVRAYRLTLGEREAKGLLPSEVPVLLQQQYGLDGITVAANCPGFADEMATDSLVTAFVWMDREVVRLASCGDDVMPGIAIDIGTTTVAVYLCDLATGEVLGSGSFANPQIAFGADVISRIAYSVRNHESGMKRMREGLVLAINGMIRELAENAGFPPSRVLDMTVVGNTVMHHIFLDVPPDTLGLSPFRPAIRESLNVPSRKLGIEINPASYIHALPVEAGFVGADNVAVILSEMDKLNAEPTLIIDIGTNGEIVLGNREKLLSCSCATGPALEGAGISRGMRAIKGAIERLRIDRRTLEVDYQVVGDEGWASEHGAGNLSPIGICGSGIIDAVAELHGAGVIEDNGTFKEKLGTIRLRKDESGSREFVLVWREETANRMEITITQRDIRQFQLAKGSLRAGCEVLMKHYGLDSIGRIVVAGAFGVHIDKLCALATGLFPPCGPDNILAVGNAAGHGAYLALMDREKRVEADRIARTTTYIELASDKDFQGTFLKALFIPYKH